MSFINNKLYISGTLPNTIETNKTIEYIYIFRASGIFPLYLLNFPNVIEIIMLESHIIFPKYFLFHNFPLTFKTLIYSYSSMTFENGFNIHSNVQIDYHHGNRYYTKEYYYNFDKPIIEIYKSLYLDADEFYKGNPRI